MELSWYYTECRSFPRKAEEYIDQNIDLKAIGTTTKICNVAGIPLFIVNSKCSNESCSLDPSVQTFTTRTRRVTSTMSNHIYFPRAPNRRKKFHSESFVFKNCSFVEQALRSAFLTILIINLFMSRVSRYKNAHFLLSAVQLLSNTSLSYQEESSSIILCFCWYLIRKSYTNVLVIIMSTLR